MNWEIEGTAEFEEWYGSLDIEDQAAVEYCVGILEREGPSLGRPYVDTVERSAYPNMKELRVQSGGRPLRAFFAFDPTRTAILLIGGDKTGDKHFYERMIPLADALYAEHLASLAHETNERNTQ